MPSEEDEHERCNLLELCITKECLLHELRANPSRLVILDCRSSNEFSESHIRNAVNFSIPSIMLRRLAAGKIDLISTIKCRDLKEKIMNAYKENLFVVYGDSYVTDERFRENGNFTAGDTINVVTKRLLQDGCRVVCLEGRLYFCCFDNIGIIVIILFEDVFDRLGGLHFMFEGSDLFYD